MTGVPADVSAAHDLVDVLTTLAVIAGVGRARPADHRGPDRLVGGAPDPPLRARCAAAR